MTIRLKLRLSVTLLILTMTLNVAVLISYHRAANQAFEDVQISERSMYRLYELSSFLRDYLGDHNERALVQWREGHRRLHETLGQKQVLAEDSRAETLTFHRILSNTEVLGGLFDKLIAGHQSREAERIIEQGLSLRASLIIADLYRFSAINNEMLNQHRKNFIRAMAVSVVTTLLSSLFVFLVSRRVMTSLARIQKAAQQIGGGDFTTPASVSGNDEFTELTKSINAMAAQLQRNYNDISRSNEELEQFAYVASHDLREPLRMVTSYMSLLERRYADKLDADAREFIGFARDGAKRLDHLVLDLLEYSRINRQGEAIVAMPALPAVQLALTSLGMAIKDSGAAVSIDEAIQSTWVMGDPMQVMRLFQNLISNSLKYRKPDIAPTIKIGGQCLDGHWEFSVADNGIGIAPEYFQRIFGIFQRLHTRDKFDGTGIGLAICKKIVERHSGKIWLESVPEEGATFFFTLPDGAVQP